MFEIIIVGNVDACRAEAEIADGSGNTVAIVYHDLDGWHTEVIDKQSYHNFSTLMENAREKLSHCVNRRGDNVPSDLRTSGALSLWLMTKDDGTAMG